MNTIFVKVPLFLAGFCAATSFIFLVGTGGASWPLSTVLGGISFALVGFSALNDHDERKDR